MNTRKIDELNIELKEETKKLEKTLEDFGRNTDLGREKEIEFFKTDCKSLKDLKVAAIMDTFTLGNFKPECRLFEIEADKWKAQMDEFSPDMLFVESAWNGKNNSWYKKIANGSKDLLDVTDYCHERNIPVVFWNKEDPVWTDAFMSAASTADFVFTTDFDVIERYKRTLQHNNVYLLHFSAQPRIHNPLEIHDRKDKFCFAGAYYHRYRERCRVFDSFADVFESGRGLEIYDRNLNNARPEHAFPDRYKSMIVGTLKPDEIHIAYKGYNYGINMNSVTDSQSMFARRVYELMASNTVCVGNYARGLKNILGDLTISTDSADELKSRLNLYCSTTEKYRKYRLSGLRRVLSSELCEDRLGFICECVFGRDLRKKLPKFKVIAEVKTDEEKEKIENSFYSQSYWNKELYFIPSGSDNSGGSVDLCGIFDESDELEEGETFVSAMSPKDYYGKNYLLDFALSTRYSCAEGFTKAGYYSYNDGKFFDPEYDVQYKKTEKAFSSRSAVKIGKLKRSEEFVRKFAEGVEIKGDFLCTDEFNYCENFSGGECEKADDIFIADKGIDPDVINSLASSIDCENLSSDVMRLTPKDMADMSRGRIRGVTYKLEGSKFVVSSQKKSDKPEYLIFKRKFLPEEFYASNQVSVLFSSTGELDTENHILFFDGAMKQLGDSYSEGSDAVTADLPEGTKFIELAVRIKGKGVREYSSITAGKGTDSSAVPFLSRSDVLVVADHYPSYSDLYRYMFVHRRIKGYEKLGDIADVACINMYNNRKYYEFEGVNVTEGNAATLSSLLENGRIKTVCVHFMNRYIWSVVKNYLSDIKLVIWSHGSDIQPYERRKFNYTGEKETEEAKIASEKRKELWNEIFSNLGRYDISMVFVSDFFRNQVEEDYNVDLKNYSYVIHNFIDSDLFNYVPKKAEDRFKVMTVKSFSSLTYANDVTQDAILKLSAEPEFSSMTFDIFGDGVRFDRDTEKIKKFSNVHLHKGFLTQAQIAEEHKKHGIYIATTRTDTQGVSRDEAMSSGLVPVANKVAAIPEFCDETNTMLCPPEDSGAVADAILKLVRNPELFLKMSENASNHVREFSPFEKTIKREAELIFPDKRLMIL